MLWRALTLSHGTLHLVLYGDELIHRVRLLSQQFLLTSIPQHHRHSHYPLLYFTGVLGIHPSNLAYRTPYQFTPILAGLLWVSRLLLLQYAQQSTLSRAGSGSGSGTRREIEIDTEHFRTI
jgi:hypothetical protein